MRHLSLSLLPQVLVTLIAGYLSELTSEQIIEEEVRVNFGITFELGNGFVLTLCQHTAVTAWVQTPTN